jgi:hypothetical protein
MKRTAPFVLAAFVASAALTTLLLVREQRHASPPPSPSPTRSSPSFWSLRPGDVVVHRAMLAQAVQADAFAGRAGPASTTGQTNLDVDLQVVGLADDPRGTLATLQFTRVHDVRVVVDGVDLVDGSLADEGAATLTSPVATIVRAPSGRVVALSVPPDAPPLWSRLVQLLLGETQFVLDDGASWDADERTAPLAVRAHYTRTDDADDHVVVTRQATPTAVQFPRAALSHTTLSGQRTARFAAGTLRALAGVEQLVVRDDDGRDVFVVDTTVSLTLVQRDRRATLPAAPARLVSIDPHVVTRDDAAARTQALSARVEGLTREELLATVTAALPTGAVPDHDRFLWRATGLLQQEPTLVATLKPLFFDARAGHEGRALVLDLLVGAAHANAQQLLCELLDTPVVQDDPRAALLRQRLTFVRHPSSETLAFVTTKAGGTDSFRDPARMSLGAMAGALARSDRSPEAAAAAQRLVDWYDDARDDDERDVLVRALGNAGVDGFDGPVLAAARADDPRVRAVAASALRKLRSPRAHAALIALMRSNDAAVSRRAIDSLGERPFSAEVAEAVQAAVVDGALPDASYQPLVNLLAKNARTDATARATLTAILSADVHDAQVKARVRQILAAVSPVGSKFRGATQGP